jgi:hypothetical protein
MPKNKPKKKTRIQTFLARVGGSTSAHISSELEFSLNRILEKKNESRKQKKKKNITQDEVLTRIQQVKIKRVLTANQSLIRKTHSSKLRAALKIMANKEKNPKHRTSFQIQGKVLASLEKFKSDPQFKKAKIGSIEYCPLKATERQDLFMQMIKYNSDASIPSTHVQSNTAGSFGEEIVLEHFKKHLLELQKSTDGVECYTGCGVFDLVMFDGNSPPQSAIVVEVKFNTSNYGTRKLKFTKVKGATVVTQCTKEYYDEMLEVMAHAKDKDVKDCAKKLKKISRSNIIYTSLRVEAKPKEGSFTPEPRFEKIVPL